MNNHPEIGSNNTSSIPNPKPIKQIAKVFFSNLHILLPPHLLYIILSLLLICYRLMATIM